MAEKTLHMIGNAHLDPVWLWEKREGFAEVISTMASAVSRIEENSQFIFTCSSSSYYEYVMENDPALFAKIKKYVQSGQWNIAGGWYVQADNNIPSGETYARHALYSQRFFQEHFGLMCKCGYTVDSFGHNANMPQLLQQGGMENFVYMRPMDNEMAGMPPLFFWKAADGSKVLTYRIVGQAYTNHNESGLERDIKAVEKYSEKYEHDFMCFYGVGNHGGGPTKRQLLLMDSMIQEGKNIQYACPDSFFNKIRAQNLALPEVTGELQIHAIGCYSVAGHIKAAQRKAENMLLKAEKLDFMAHKLLGTPVENSKLQDAYKRVLFNTFHDIICGCSVKDGLDAAIEDYSYAISAARDIIDKSIITISKNIDTMIDGYENLGKSDIFLYEENDNGVPVMLFNTDGHAATKPVQISRMYKTIVDEKGKSVPIQYVFDRFLNGSEDKALFFNATLPANGYTTYWLYRTKVITPESVPPEVTARPNLLENDLLKVTFDKGAVVSITDKKTGREHLGGASFTPYVIDDKSDTWSHGLSIFPQLNKRDFTLTDVSVVEQGAVLGKVRFRYRLDDSYCVQDFSLYNGENFIRTSVKIIYHQFNSICRITAHVKGGLNFSGEVAYGHTDMRSDGSESVVQQYGALTGKSGAGIALITQNKPSFCADGEELSFIAVRNSIYANHDGARFKNTEYDSTDDGLHKFDYLIYPYAALSHSDIRTTADQLYSFEYLVDTYHTGPLKRTYSLCHTDKHNIRTEVIKTSEDGNSTIIRMYETEYSATTVKLFYDTNEFDLKFRPGEIKTVSITAGKAAQVNFVEIQEDYNG